MLLIVFVYGLFIGSFLNVCIFRIPSEISIITPPSYCYSCGHKLSVFDMLPIISYVRTKGKCFYCKKKYSIQYPLIELINAIIYVFLIQKYSINIVSLYYCVISSIMLVIGMIDLKYHIIYDNILFFLLIFNIIISTINLFDFRDSIIGCIISFAIFYSIDLVTNAMGGGDIKLMSVLGFIFGIKGILFIIFFSFIIGATISILLICCGLKQRKDMIAFAPFVTISVYIYILYGDEILRWYFSIIS